MAAVFVDVVRNAQLRVLQHKVSGVLTQQRRSGQSEKYRGMLASDSTCVLAHEHLARLYS
jgi:hypothetical protein